MLYKDKDGFVARYIGAVYEGSLGKKEVVPMRRISLLIVAVLALSVLLVVPATAQSWGDHWGGFKWGDHNDKWGDHDDDDKWRDDDDKWRDDDDKWRDHNWSKSQCDWFWSWKWGWLRWCWSPWSGWHVAWW